MTKRSLLGLATGALFLASCATTQINYSITSVAEEGGMQFTQLNNPEEENTVGPGIYTSGIRLVWNAAPLMAISPDGEKLVYVQRKNNIDNLYLRSTKGGASVMQRTFSANSIAGCSYSPDGKHISYSDKKDGSFNIYQINANEGAAVQQISSTNSDEVTPVYSPDGKYIFYTKEERELQANGTYKSRYFIWFFDREKSAYTQLIEGYTPSISPDGKTLIYTKSKQNNDEGEIWMMDIQTGSPSLLMTATGKGFSTPQISPDGKKVLCVGSTNKTKNARANLDIYVFNVDGTGLTQLTFNPVHDVCPRWSPDGKAIYFISQRGSKTGKFSLWKINYDK